MRIVAASDTHMRHALLDIPECDIFIHSGDATWKGKGLEFREFARWMQKIPARHKVFVPGNHDIGFETDPGAFREIMGDTIVLIDESATIEGIRFYGSPWTPWYNNWAFNFPRFDSIPPHSVSTSHWEKIPLETQFLVTHGPPMGVLDMTMRGARVGDVALSKRIESLGSLVYHQFGHIHEDGGILVRDKVVFHNASAMNELSRLSNPVRVFRFDGQMHLENEIQPSAKSG